MPKGDRGPYKKKEKRLCKECDGVVHGLGYCQRCYRLFKVFGYVPRCASCGDIHGRPQGLPKKAPFTCKKCKGKTVGHLEDVMTLIKLKKGGTHE